MRDKLDRLMDSRSMNMQTTRAAMCGAALLATLAACGGKTDTPVVTTTAEGAATSPAGESAAKSGTSMVRLVNAIPGGATVNVTGDDKALFDNVGAKDITTYAQVKDNMVAFRLRGAGKDSVLADNSESLLDGNRYTILALTDDKGNVKLKVMRDEVVPDAGKARIRVINAVPGLDDIAVAWTGQKDALFGDVDYGAEAGYKDIDPVTSALEIRRTDKGPRLVSVKSQKFEAGKAYTIVLTGTKTKVETIVFDDAVTGGGM